MVGWWNGSLLQSNARNRLRTMDNPLEEGVIELPFSGEKGVWTEKHASRLDAATSILEDAEEITATIASMKTEAKRNQYRLEVYEQVNQLVSFSAEALLVLKAYDIAGDEQEAQEALNAVQQLSEKFVVLKTDMEQVYSQTRVLTKPEGYLLDQDHHRHLANQSASFDWQYAAELAFLEKLHQQILLW